MAQVVIIYHSGYGHTKKLAEAVLAGAESVTAAKVELIAIDAEGNVPENTWDKLAAADAIIFGSPTYMGSVSWQFKKFADASSKPWFTEAWKDKIAAGFTNSSSMNGDKHSTLHYLVTLAMQHGMSWIGLGMLPSNKKESERNDPNYMGSFVGLMSQSPSNASPEEGPLPGDLETGKKYGVRIAEKAVKAAKAK